MKVFKSTKKALINFLFFLRKNKYNKLLKTIHLISKRFQILMKVEAVIRSDLDPRNLNNLPSKNYILHQGLFGETQRINLNDYIGWKFFLDGYFELETPILARQLYKDKIINNYYDIGCHIGLELIPIACNDIPSYGFEPHKVIYNQLCHNVKQNNLKNVVTYNLGAYSSNLEGKIFSAKNNSGASSIYEKWHLNIDETEQSNISLVRLDTLLNHDFSRSLLKIDVEGAEAAVLEGLGNNLLSKPVIIFEYYKNKNNVFDSQFISKYLEQNYLLYAVEVELINNKEVTISIKKFNLDYDQPSVLAVPIHMEFWVLNQNGIKLNLNGG